MPRMHLGCAGYSYDDWHGRFYPKELPPAERLAYYAERFSFVELNFSYYAMPKAAHLARMAEHVPEGFLFSIKAHASLTHKPDGEWLRRAEEFREAVCALGSQLAGVLLQFPYSFHYTRENRRYLAQLVDGLRGGRGDSRSSGGDAGGGGATPGAAEMAPALFVEFRNVEWERDSVIAGMRKRGLHRVLVDTPNLPGLPTSFGGGEALPTDRLYLRLHGRNRENWWKGTNVSRYDYNYGSEELSQLAGRIKKMETAELFVVFNNHANAQAPLNALRLLELVKVE
ncbi:MAG: DUF72 domain-containing protein [Alkalispirochaetaceae bacterium]